MADEERMVADWKKNNGIMSVLCGRYNIYTSVDDLTSEDVVAEVNSALTIHFMNLMAWTPLQMKLLCHLSTLKLSAPEYFVFPFSCLNHCFSFLS